MKKNSKWTPEEEARLTEILSEVPGLTNAFKAFHEEFPYRSVASTSARWYGTLRLRNDINVCLATIKKENITEPKIKKGIFSRLFNFLFFMFK